ncbi:MAG TPA: SpoIIE family protein phosphatase [Pyrinomonadaceae bacterium]
MVEPKQIEGKGGGLRRTQASVGRVLRLVMPPVGAAAGVLFVVWIFVNDTRAYRETYIGPLLGILTFIAICLTLIYYGYRALRWVKRKLLWRVRRRLVITYLFVGLTPIILLSLLGLLSAFGGSAQGIARIISSQVNATEKETQASARKLADGLTRLPTNSDDRGIKAWLEEQVALLRATLPGARVALWRGGTGENERTVGQQAAAQFFTDDTEDLNARSIGSDPSPLETKLPDWVSGRAEWSGLTFTLPANSDAKFGVPSMRAVVRGQFGNRPFTLLLVVPISRALIQRYSETTGINIRPFFVGSSLIRLDIGRTRGTRRAEFRDTGPYERIPEEMFDQDQFGEPIEKEGLTYPVVLNATNWTSGESSPHLGFLFNWSFTLARKQFFGSGEAGEIWRQALWIVAAAFLVLELLALVAAIWMTRAVTGTVHKLHSAVGYIKRGDFSHRVKVRSQDQLGELASAFNDMSGNIEALLEERVERERLEREVEIAAEVQAQLFPRRVPELTTAEISAECRAARGVAGDYYDYIEIAPGLVALALGDVSGKGVSASLVMSNLQASLRAQTTITTERLSIAERATAASVETGSSSGGGGGKLLAYVVADAEIDGAVSRNMTNINRQLCQSTEANRFATLFLAIYEDRMRRLHYTNAGHNAPILVRVDGTVERLTTGGMMVGAFDWAVYEEASVELQPGELLLIFSDGINEAESDAGVEYGEERLLRFAVEHRTLRADELRNAIFEEIDAWSGPRERGDDQTLVILKSGV